MDFFSFVGEHVQLIRGHNNIHRFGSWDLVFPVCVLSFFSLVGRYPYYDNFKPGLCSAGGVAWFDNNKSNY
jgi:hypothetical protein